MLPQDPSTANSEPQGESAVHLVNALLRFLVVVRYRKQIVLAALAAAALLGSLYYATATRIYSSKASLLVMTVGPDMASSSVAGSTAMQQNCTSTFENLITTTKVVEGAVQTLQKLQAEGCTDLAGIPRESWIGTIQAGLSAKAIRGTNIITVSYNCKNPTSGVHVLNAVIQSYVEFLDKTNKGTAGEIIRVLTKEKVELAEKMAKKEQEMLDARSQVGDLGVRSDGKTQSPSIQKVFSFNESLIQTQKRRIELEALLITVQTAMRNGEDMQQYLVGMADALGKEILLRSLGFDPHDTATLSSLDRSLLDDRTVLKTMQEHLGPAHPEVLAKIEKIRMCEQYMLDYQQRVRQRMSELQNTQLGPMLVQMVQQKLSEAQRLESALQTKYAEARDSAVNLNGQLARLDILEHDLKWLRDLHDVLLNRIASIDLKHEGSDIRTAVVEEPKGGGRPISPNLRMVIVLVLAGGFGAGLLIVCLMDILDDRFRSLDELQSQLGVPVLSIVRQLQATDALGIDSVHMHISPDSAEGEAFRTLRTALALAEQETRRLVISSTEPGDGKTTVLANLAVCFAQADKKTLVIDADLRRPGMTAMLGMRSVDGLSRVLRGEEDVAGMAVACIRASGVDGLDILPSGARLSNPTEWLAGPRFSELLAWAETVYDQVLVDCPPLLVTSDVVVVGRLVDGLILVVQPDKNRRRQVVRSMETMLGMKVPVLGIVINRVGSEQDRGYYGYSSGYGYGYGYSNGYGYGDEQSGEGKKPTASGGEAGPGSSEHACTTPATCPIEQPQRSSPGIVPRRAA